MITVHDLTNERMNDGTSQTQTVLSWKKNLIEKGSHIITVSENTRSDLIDYYHYNPEKVTTAHLSVDFRPSFDIPVRQDINILPDRYLLL
ncbi:MAG: hypothetical protein IPM85_14390 [Chitinophagaceae bacterium]|nr:hypothetical protein [Chitinophagaceae bacterium]